MKRTYKRAVAGLLAAILLLLPALAAGDQKEFRAVWVSTVYNLDYPTKGTVDVQKLKQEADAILQGCKDLGMNAVILQVRPSCDAFYPSAYFPWSKYLTGEPGVAPLDGFDPLAYWVGQAHALGLELHAWINPFRVTKGGAEELNALPDNSPAKLHPEWVVEYKENYYLNPGIPEVRELVIQGAEELVRNYQIDGIHLDDYFYPGTQFNDADAYAQYGAGFSNIDDWRRDNVNLLVRDMGVRLHTMNPNLSYGISPSGIWADKGSMEEGSNTTSGYESYFSSYADSRRWVKEGWIDYICPQLYWQIGHAKADYNALVHWWADTTRGTGVRLYIGMADYMAENIKQDSPWYGTKAIEDQLILNRSIPEVAGEVHFRYQFLAKSSALQTLYKTYYGVLPAPTPVPTPEPVPESWQAVTGFAFKGKLTEH